MNKPTLTKEQAEAIEVVKKRNPNNYSDFIKIHSKSPDDWVDFAEPINHMPLETLVRSLYIGYTVEQTPEEKVREYYNTLIQNEDCNVHECYAVKKVLELLDMQHILEEGVNDK